MRCLRLRALPRGFTQVHLERRPKVPESTNVYAIRQSISPLNRQIENIPGPSRVNEITLNLVESRDFHETLEENSKRRVILL